tara:strand:+ start:1231 stop:3045 length:1815 start_codon:yes stop_codon:yes gene_type:complete
MKKIKHLTIYLPTALFFIIFSSVSFGESIEGPPEFNISDENQVNLVTGRRSITKTDLSIGTGEMALTHTINTFRDNFRSYRGSYTGDIVASSSVAVGGVQTASLGGMSETFRIINGVYASKSSDGGQLTEINATEWLWITGSGIKVYYLDDGSIYHNKRAVKVVYPNGMELEIHYNSRGGVNGTEYRIQSVTSSNGLQLHYRYGSNSSSADYFDWSRPIEITAINNAVEYCSPTAYSCSLTQTWPSVTYSWPGAYQGVGYGGDFVITEPSGISTVYTHSLYCKTGPGASSCGNDNLRISKIVESTSSGVANSEFEYGNQYHCSSNGFTWTCDTLRQGLVSKSIKGGAEWTYSYSQPLYQYVPIQANSNGPTNLSILINNFTNEPYEITDYKTGNVINLIKGSKVESVEYSYGNSLHFIYDVNGNITERKEVAKSGSGLADTISTANYNNNCSNDKTIKKAAWVKDGKSYQTDMTYHCNSGMISKVTKPSDSNGIRPQTRYFYSQKYAYYKNSSGNITKSNTPIWLLTSESTCLLGAASGNGCASASDEIKTTYSYGNTSVANNLFLKGVATTSNGETRRACYSYDNYGNKLSETQPKANLPSCN